jgi:hypothetical protein
LSAAGEAGQAPPTGQGSPEPSEEELRAAYEAELSRITATDMMAQAAISLLNIGARRLAPADGDRGPGDQAGGEQPGGQAPSGGAPPSGAQTGGAAPGRDLEQARDAIDAARALLDILERRIPQELRPLRDALSRLQMTYAREVGSGGAGAAEKQPAAAAPGAQGEPSPGGEGPAAERPPGPGPAEVSGRLWVPGR